MKRNVTGEIKINKNREDKSKEVQTKYTTLVFKISLFTFTKTK